MDLYRLHKRVYRERPMRISYAHPNPVIRYIENKRLETAAGMIESTVSNYSILDIGCEECPFFSRLQKPIFKLGIDFLPEPLYSIKGRYPCIVADINHLPLKNGVFDVVVCLETLEHVADPEKSLKEIKRVASSHAVFSVPNDDLVVKFKRLLSPLKSVFLKGLEEGRVPEHVQSWNKDTFIDLIKSAFKIKEIKTLPFSFLPLKIVVLCETH